MLSCPQILLYCQFRKVTHKGCPLLPSSRLAMLTLQNMVVGSSLLQRNLPVYPADGGSGQNLPGPQLDTPVLWQQRLEACLVSPSPHNLSHKWIS